MLGILGGMGPLASAEFLKTIYDYTLAGEPEQQAPRIILYSDPSLPDRTQALLSGDDEPLRQHLIAALSSLNDRQVSKIIICCLTSHYLLPQAPKILRDKVISLIEVILQAVLARDRQYLLLCTNGARKLKIFQSHPLWPQVQNQIILPDETDQQTVHQLIYQIKRNQHPFEPALFRLKDMLSQHRADAMIAGCTEIHLLYRYAQSQSRSYDALFLDPLVLIAQQFNQLCLA